MGGLSARRYSHDRHVDNAPTWMRGGHTSAVCFNWITRNSGIMGNCVDLQNAPRDETKFEHKFELRNEHVINALGNCPIIPLKRINSTQLDCKPAYFKNGGSCGQHSSVVA